MADEQDVAEAFDEDKIEDLDYPPDNPLGVDDPTSDDRVTDSISERVMREETEARSGVGEVALVDPDAGGAPDLEKDLVGEAVSTDDDVADQLVNDRVPAPAEETAVHLAPEP